MKFNIYNRRGDTHFGALQLEELILNNDFDLWVVCSLILNDWKIKYFQNRQVEFGRKSVINIFSPPKLFQNNYNEPGLGDQNPKLNKIL